MKSFHFRLEHVLHYFRQQELVQSMVVAEVERRLQNLRRERSEQMIQKDRVEEDIRLKHQSLPPEELIRFYAHGAYLTRRIHSVDENMQLASEELKQEHTSLLVLTKRRRVVEELRSRKRDVYDGELERFEVAGIDEINARRIPMSGHREDVA